MSLLRPPYKLHQAYLRVGPVVARSIADRELLGTNPTLA